jgi:mediator of RNA polymerase II transcription subunit 8
MFTGATPCPRRESLCATSKPLACPVPLGSTLLTFRHSSSIQASTQIIQSSLQDLLNLINSNAGLLSSMTVRPSSNFPGTQHEGALQALVRKKPDLEVEAAIEKSRRFIDEEVTQDGLRAMHDVWTDARSWIQQRIMTYVSEEAGEPYTKEEEERGVENVRTGLKRDLYEEDDENEDENMEGVDKPKEDTPKEDKGKEGPEIPRGPEPETLLWFAARGDFAVPDNVQYSRQDGQAPYKGLQGVNIPHGEGDLMQDDEP